MYIDLYTICKLTCKKYQIMIFYQQNLPFVAQYNLFAQWLIKSTKTKQSYIDLHYCMKCFTASI